MQTSTEQSTLWQRVSFPLLALLCLAYCWRPLEGSDDVWAHAAIGRWIVEQHTVPDATLFIWGATPIRWIYHSWLSQVIFYGCLSPGEKPGALLLILLTATIVIAVFFLLWKLWQRCDESTPPAWLSSVFALAIYCSSLRFHPRPELFTALSLCVLLVFFVRHEKKERVPFVSLLGIVLLFVFWANLHGAVAIGLLLIWTTTICDSAQDLRENSKLSLRSRQLVFFAIACTMAICLNPYGLEYWRALQPVGGAAFSRIDEWKPFWRAPLLNPLMVAGEGVLVLLAFCAWRGNERRRWAYGAWLLVVALLFLTARRHLWLLPVTCLAVMAANSQALRTSLSRLAPEEKINPAAGQFASVAVLALWLLNAAPPLELITRLTASNLPENAVQVVRKRHPRARVFNDYENSSYLQWRLGGKPPLFIDLLNAYPEQLVFDYLDIVHARPRGKTLLNEKHIEVVILRKYPPDTPLTKLVEHLKKSGEWRCEYSGSDGTVWMRRTKHTS